MGVYIHVPFCKQACHYCNFHFSTSLRHRESMVLAMVKEVDLTVGYLRESRLSSVYLGGGTPSILPEQDLARILDTLHAHYELDQDTEITLEANPDDISRAQVDMWTRLGINRLSIGIQSFHDEDLKAMNRAHDASEADACVKIARESGITDISIDLIYGATTTSDAMWRYNVDRAIDLDVDHISAYCLTVEEGTALAAFVKRGTVADLDDSKAHHQFYYLIDQLSQAGYEHYEISNFARDGKYAVHNTAYWTGKSYLGIGPSAHSYDGQDRRYNVANNAHYLKAIAEGQIPFTMDKLSPTDRYHDYLLTAIRTKWGVMHEVIEKDYPFALKHYWSAVQIIGKQGLVSVSDRSTTLTSEGKFLADQVTLDLMM